MYSNILVCFILLAFTYLINAQATQIGFVHAFPGQGTIDFYADGKLMHNAIGYKGQSSPFYSSNLNLGGFITFEARVGGTNTAIITKKHFIISGARYTIILTGRSDTRGFPTDLSLFQDSAFTACFVTAGTGRFRAINAARGLGLTSLVDLGTTPNRFLVQNLGFGTGQSVPFSLATTQQTLTVRSSATQKDLLLAPVTFGVQANSITSLIIVGVFQSVPGTPVELIRINHPACPPVTAPTFPPGSIPGTVPVTDPGKPGGNVNNNNNNSNNNNNNNSPAPSPSPPPTPPSPVFAAVPTGDDSNNGAALSISFLVIALAAFMALFMH